MNSFLNFQNQLEEQFLNASQAENFVELCVEHIDFFREHIQPRFNYADFSQRTTRATNPLKHIDDLMSYMAMYGIAHYQRLRELFDGYTLPSMQNTKKLYIVDYVCGQGIASLAYLDHCLEMGLDLQQPIHIILVEPSTLALKRAVYWINKKAKQHQLNIQITAHNCHFDDLDTCFLANELDSHCIHLLSNILDMYHTGSYSLQNLTKHMRNSGMSQQVFAVSPEFQSGTIGFQCFHALLQPRELHEHTCKNIEIVEYHVNLSRLQKRVSKARFYAATL